MSEDLTLLITLILGYLIGSVPFAYLITKRATGRDVRQEGTGNVGTRNAFVVSRKFGVGISVLLADLLKGALPVLFWVWSGRPELLVALLPALILGHCYPIWLRFHGGKGLATTAGALLVTFPIFPSLWGVAYLIVKRLRNDVDFATIVASGVSLIAVLLVPVELIQWSAIGSRTGSIDPRQVQLSICLVILIILSRHAEPIRLLFDKEEKA
jgi:glycerol-3-phosphate acyltransferase PlsY